jgi:hypothetical protein
MKISVKLAPVIGAFNIIGTGLPVGLTLIKSEWEISRLMNEGAAGIALQT